MPSSLKETQAYLFAAASVAAIRNRLQAKKAEREGKPSLARLLNALASSEDTHIRRFAMYLRGKSSGSEAYLSDYRDSKKKGLGPLYRRLAQLYDTRGESGKSENLRQFGQVLDSQADLMARYQSAAEAMPAGIHVCQVCGFVTLDSPPDKCPICNAVREKFDLFGV